MLVTVTPACWTSSRGTFQSQPVSEESALEFSPFWLISWAPLVQVLNYYIRNWNTVGSFHCVRLFRDFQEGEGTRNIRLILIYNKYIASLLFVLSVPLLHSLNNYVVLARNFSHLDSGVVPAFLYYHLHFELIRSSTDLPVVFVD